MDSKDKIIQEQKERIIALNEEIQRLHALLSEAGIHTKRKRKKMWLFRQIWKWKM